MKNGDHTHISVAITDHLGRRANRGGQVRLMPPVIYRTYDTLRFPSAMILSFRSVEDDSEGFFWLWKGGETVTIVVRRF